MSEQIQLQLNQIHKSFSGIEVLHGVSFELRKGEVLGIVGENGAGKSTMMSIIGGLYSHDSGSMAIEGQPYIPQTPGDAYKAGIAFVHQEFSLFTNLSVADNLFVDRYPHKSVSIDRKYMTERTQAYIDLFKLDITPATKVENLPMGIRQIIEISKALEKKPKILILDEPTTSLSPKEKDQLFEVIEELRSRQVSIIYISHILDDVIKLCNRTLVLRDGYSVGQFDNRELDKKAVIKHMVGRELNQVYPTVEKEIGQPIYSASSFTRRGASAPISFDIKAGEIVGMFGLMGAGRTELLNALFGTEPNDGGEITVNGKKLSRPTPEKCIKAGMAFITENRRQEGLVMPKTVGENLGLVVMDRMLHLIKMIDRSKEHKLINELVQRFSIKTADAFSQSVRFLSGGNQQKVVVAKWCTSEPSVFFMDEPTRGVDVGAKYEIYTIINDLAKEGCGVLMVSSEMEELMGMCDRILVMHRNRITADIPKDKYDSELIIQYALEEEKENAG